MSRDEATERCGIYEYAALEYYPHYGDAVRLVREANNLTQEAISDATSFSTRHLSRIENGEQKPTLKLMDKLAFAHKLSFDEYLKRLVAICSDFETKEQRRRRASKN